MTSIVGDNTKSVERCSALAKVATKSNSTAIGVREPASGTDEGIQVVELKSVKAGQVDEIINKTNTSVTTKSK